MSCALTTGYTLDCRDSIGGIKNVHFIEFANVTSMTETAGVITALVKAVTKNFYRYELPRETSSFKCDIQGNEQNGSLFFTHTLKVILNKLQTTMRNEILLLAKNKLIIVVEDKNGKFWMLGRTGGMFLSGGSLDTGTNAGDRNGFELDFTGTEAEPPIEVVNAVGLILETAG